MDNIEHQDIDNIRWDATLQIHERDVVAVEHPLIVKNLNNGIRTFGLGQPFDRILDEKDPKGCIPLYIRPNDPMCPALLSHNSQTRNVLLKITVPMRTGRKRKRGTDGPFLGEVKFPEVDGDTNNPPRGLSLAATGMEESRDTLYAKRIRSQRRLDNPREILKTLQDNVNNYTMEAVANIPYTHRFRGPANFQHSTSNTEFMPNFQELVCSGDVGKIRQFKLSEKRGWKDNGTFFPPPMYTSEALPSNWTGLVNEPKQTYAGSRPSSKSHQINYVVFNVPVVPSGTDLEIPDDPDVLSCIARVREAFEERPMWTRRALLSYLRSPLPKYYFDIAIGYVCYQFKSGPFREAIVKYGLDPRTDPKYYIYQTIFFADRQAKGRWADPRGTMEEMKGKYANSYIFDGKTIIPDGSVYMICDITDPLITNMLHKAPLRKEYDGQAQGDGYISNGAMAKTKAIMKAKIIAIQNGRKFTDKDFASTLEFPDVKDDNAKPSRDIGFLVPDIAPTSEEVRMLTGVEKSIPLLDLSNDARRRRMRIAEREEGIKPVAQPKLRRQRQTKKQATPKKQTQEEYQAGFGTLVDNAATNETPPAVEIPVVETPVSQPPNGPLFPAFARFLDDQEQLELGGMEDDFGGFEEEETWMAELNEGGIPSFTMELNSPELHTDLHTERSQISRPFTEPTGDTLPLREREDTANDEDIVVVDRDITPKPVQRPDETPIREEDGAEGDDDSDATDVVDFKAVPLKKLPGPAVF